MRNMFETKLEVWNCKNVFRLIWTRLVWNFAGIHNKFNQCNFEKNKNQKLWDIFVTKLEAGNCKNVFLGNKLENSVLSVFINKT